MNWNFRYFQHVEWFCSWSAIRSCFLIVQFYRRHWKFTSMSSGDLEFLLIIWWLIRLMWDTELCLLLYLALKTLVWIREVVPIVSGIKLHLVKHSLKLTPLNNLLLNQMFCHIHCWIIYSYLIHESMPFSLFSKKKKKNTMIFLNICGLDVPYYPIILSFDKHENHW